jgi:hypothetical protein
MVAINVLWLETYRNYYSMEEKSKVKGKRNGSTFKKSFDKAFYHLYKRCRTGFNLGQFEQS